MDASLDPRNLARYGTMGWLTYVLVAVVVEKIIQHSVVTLAMFFNWGDIRSTVAVSPNVLIVLGAIVAVLFSLSLWGIATHPGRTHYICSTFAKSTWMTRNM
jgi:hypothetical protein